VGDGAHRITVAAFDATDANRGAASRTVLIDNHAPAEPGSPAVVGGEGWHTSDDFTIQWANPASAAPITRALYEVCRPGGSSCVSGEQAGSGISQLSGVHVGQPGDYTIRVWLADAAGNVSDAKSAPLHLKFDNVPPAQAQPQHRNGWVNESDAKRLDQQIDPNGSPPVSGISGYAVTTDGTEPGATVNVPARSADGYVGHLDLTELPEGTTTVKARAISGAGIPSTEVGSTDTHVDRTAPQLAIAGVPDEQHWSRTPVAARVTATDLGDLSGMASAAHTDAPFGGYIELALDQAENKKWWGPAAELGPDGRFPHVPGNTSELVIADDGIHRLTYRGSDAAGNVTPTRSVGFKIDRTAPELAVFEAQRASDPSLIEVGASDRTSGLADDGEIRLRRIAPTQGPWVALNTARQGDRYYAHLQNATLIDGDYEFVATIPDQAGNEALAHTDRDGRAEILHISPTQVGPYATPIGGGQLPHSEEPTGQGATPTTATRLKAAAVERTVLRKKCKRGSKGRRKPCPRRGVRELLVHDLRVGYGQKALVRGSLTTSGGAPIAGAEITVLARPAMAGGDYRAVAAVTTDRGGRFTYRVSAGSSRTLDFHFRGDSKYKHSDEQVTLRVPAAATMKASRHSIRNGGSVTFSGRLRGRPYPVRGKVLDLQAFYRGSWRTFATPRATKSGKWTYRYRFGATHGSVLYRFRARVRATSDYPYELGYSKTATVRVHG
jgi:hypothetical protein